MAPPGRHLDGASLLHVTECHVSCYNQIEEGIESMANVATRLLSMILLLQSRPSWKASELAQEFNVSERTVHRYIIMLEEMGIPIYSERGPYGGFSLVRGYKLPPLLFSAEEATVLYMGANLVREVLGQTYDEAVTAATAKLDNVLPDELRQQVADTQRGLIIGDLMSRDYRPWAETIDRLRQCIGDRRRARIIYRSYGNEGDTEREVDPYGLSLQWGLWYLVAFCRLRGELRTFRVDRIQEAEPLKSTFSRPRDFSLRDYLSRTMSFEPAHIVAVQLDARIYGVVRERHGHWMRLGSVTDGHFVAEFGVATLDWATGWILGHGAMAKALQPPELVERVMQAARGALDQYAPSQTGTHPAPEET